MKITDYWENTVEAVPPVIEKSVFSENNFV